MFRIKMIAKTQKQQTTIRIIKNVLFLLILIPFSWVLGQVIGLGIITLLQYYGLDDNLFRLLYLISI
jgi:hypothetical protein